MKNTTVYKYRIADFQKLAKKGIYCTRDGQAVVVNLNSGEKVIVSINRMKSPHRLKITTENANLQWKPSN